MPLNKVNLAEKLEQFHSYWSPHIVASLNDYDVMVVKVKDDFVWHKHDDTDDFFLVLKGELTLKLRDNSGELEPVVLSAGELCVVPKGLEHCPVASEETHILLIEPGGTPNTGNEATAARKVVI